MLNRYYKASTYLLLTFTLTACSSIGFGDLFSNYNTQMRDVKLALQRGDFQQALSLVPNRGESDGSYNLSLLEKSRLAYLSDDYQQSQQGFESTYQLTQQAEQAAKIQLSRGLENTAAVFSNDNVIRYNIPFYEQSMLHSYQALNYLNQNDLSGALVEIRRANLVQNKALRENQKSITEAKQAMKAEGVSNQALAKKYPPQNNVIGKIKNGFQNAYTFYLSGVLYEAAGEKNDAYIDYKKALEIYPQNITVQKDCWRLANDLGMQTDIQKYKQTISSSITRKAPQRNMRAVTKAADDIEEVEEVEGIDKQYLYPTSSTQNTTGQLVIIVEQGIINSKQEVGIQLPIFTSNNDVRFYGLALPSYPNHLRHYSGVTLNYNDKHYQSNEIVRLQSLAAKQLQDDMPATVARQIARVIAKEEVRQQLSRKGGDVGNILATLYNIASEKADTRSWSTLPDSIHILRINLTEGQHELPLYINGNKRNIKVNINKNRQTLLTMTAIDRYTNFQLINL